MDFLSAPYVFHSSEGVRITKWDAENLRRLQPVERGPFKSILDALGRNSAQAQDLKAVITTFEKLLNTDHRLYIASARSGNNVLVKGFLKVGCKTLFVTSEGNPQLREIRPLCVLDFYVHESCQRSGIGRRLFDHMLTEESVVPAKLAYDRPSPKLIAFLRKHFGLSKYVPQTNNFVVFSQYFCEGPERAGRSLKQEDSVDGFFETRMKQQGNRSVLESGPSRTRLGTAFSRRSPAASDSESGHTAGAENDSMRGHGRRNSEGSQIFGKVDENARGAADWQAACSNSLGSGPQCSKKHGSNGFCGQDKLAPGVPMHGRRSRRGSSETDSCMGTLEPVSVNEEAVPHAPTHGRRASSLGSVPRDQFLTTASSAAAGFVGHSSPNGLFAPWSRVPAKSQDPPGKQGSPTLKRNEEAREVSAVARTVRSMHMSGKGAAEVLGANNGFLIEAYKDAYRQALPRSRQRIQ